MSRYVEKATEKTVRGNYDPSKYQLPDKPVHQKMRGKERDFRLLHSLETAAPAIQDRMLLLKEIQSELADWRQTTDNRLVRSDDVVPDPLHQNVSVNVPEGTSNATKKIEQKTNDNTNTLPQQEFGLPAATSEVNDDDNVSQQQESSIAVPVPEIGGRPRDKPSREATQQTEPVAVSSERCRCKTQTLLETHLDPSLLVLNVPCLSNSPREMAEELLESSRKLIEQVDEQLSEVNKTESLVRLLQVSPYTSETEFANSDDSQLYVKNLVNKKLQELLMSPKPQESMMTDHRSIYPGQKNYLLENIKNVSDIPMRNASKIRHSHNEIHIQKRAVHSEEIVKSVKHENSRTNLSKLSGDHKLRTNKYSFTKSNQTNAGVKKAPKVSSFVSENVSSRKEQTQSAYENKIAKNANFLKRNLGNASTTLFEKTAEAHSSEVVRNSRLRSVCKTTSAKKCPCRVCTYEMQHEETSSRKNHPDVVKKKDCENESIRATFKICSSRNYSPKSTGSPYAEFLPGNKNAKYLARQPPVHFQPQLKHVKAGDDTARSRKFQEEAKNAKQASEAGGGKSSKTRDEKEEIWADILNTGGPSSSVMQSVLSFFADKTSSRRSESRPSCPMHGAGTLRGQSVSKVGDTSCSAQKGVTFQEPGDDAEESSCSRSRHRGAAGSLSSTTESSDPEDFDKDVYLRGERTATGQPEEVATDSENSGRSDPREEVREVKAAQPIVSELPERNASERMGSVVKSVADGERKTSKKMGAAEKSVADRERKSSERMGSAVKSVADREHIKTSEQTESALKSVADRERRTSEQIGSVVKSVIDREHKTYKQMGSVVKSVADGERETSKNMGAAEMSVADRKRKSSERMGSAVKSVADREHKSSERMEAVADREHKTSARMGSAVKSVADRERMDSVADREHKTSAQMGSAVKSVADRERKSSERMESVADREHKTSARMGSAVKSVADRERKSSEQMGSAVKSVADRERNSERPSVHELEPEERPEVSSPEVAVLQPVSQPQSNTLQASPIEETAEFLEVEDTDGASVPVDAFLEDSVPSPTHLQQAAEPVQIHPREMQVDWENASEDEEAEETEYDDDWEEEPEEEQMNYESGHETNRSSDAPASGRRSSSEHSMLGTPALEPKSGTTSESGSFRSEHCYTDKGSGPSSSQQVAASEAERTQFKTSALAEGVTSKGSDAAATQQEKCQETHGKENPTSAICAPSSSTVFETSNLLPLSAPHISLSVKALNSDVPDISGKRKPHKPGDISQLIPHLTTSTKANDSQKLHNSVSQPDTSSNEAIFPESAAEIRQAMMKHLYQSNVPGPSTAESLPPPVLNPSVHAPNMTSFFPVHAQIPPAALFMPFPQIPYFLTPAPVQNQYCNQVHFPERTNQQSSNLFEGSKTVDPARETSRVTRSTSPVRSDHERIPPHQSMHVPPSLAPSRNRFFDQPSETVCSAGENPSLAAHKQTPTLPPTNNSTCASGKAGSGDGSSDSSLSSRNDNVARSANKGIQANFTSRQVKGVQACDVFDEVRTFKEKVRSYPSATSFVWRRKEALRRQAVPSPIVEAVSENSSTSDESGCTRDSELPPSVLPNMAGSSTTTDVTPSCSDLSEGELCLSSDSTTPPAPAAPPRSPGEVSQCDCSEGEVCPHGRQRFRSQSVGELLPWRSVGQVTAPVSLASSGSDSTQRGDIPEMQSSNLSSSCDAALDSFEMTRECFW
ncbi:uncharacterized protein LOC134539640 [Bacillus rossius redtenbacheri]|uniref:uncharacterized protein LOC134539640 n=1 Tax=Bacillus rossius redtenbacheri TaxID=93214 RepID=UPI002FDCE436